jgi:hypothetical protein
LFGGAGRLLGALRGALHALPVLLSSGVQAMVKWEWLVAY